MALTRGSGKGIQVIVGTDYNDKDLKRLERDLRAAGLQAKRVQGPMAQLGAGIRKHLTPNLMLAGAAAAAFAIKVGVDAVKAAAAEEQAVARLATALDNAGQAMALDGVERFIDSLARATGVADDQLRPAMVTLVNATQDAAQAQSLLSLALDISAGSGRDLSSVTMALAKAANGQVTALRRLGVPLSDAAAKSKDLNAITGELQRTFQGQAAKAADTFQGRLNRLGVALGELQESLGTGFINGLQGGANGTDDLADAIRDLEPAAEGLGSWVGEQIKGFGDLSFLIGKGAEQLGIFNSEAAKASEGGYASIIDRTVEWALSTDGLLTRVSDLRDMMEEANWITESAAEQHADYRDAVVRAGDAAKGSVTSIGDMGQAVTESGDEAEDAAEKFDLFAAAIAKTDQVVAFRQALDEVSDAFKRGQTPVNIYTDKGQENFDNLKGLIERTASYAESVESVASRAAIASQGLGSLEGAFKNAKMDTATRALLLEPFQALIDDLRDAGVDVTNLQIKLDRLKSKTIDVTVKTTTLGGRPPGVSAEEWYGAVGGRVPRFFAGGGAARGSDTVPAMLAPGEFVIRRSAVRQFGADVFSQLNRGINPLAGISPAASGRGGGLSIGSINVTSVAGERAETSLPRALRRMAFLAGMS